MSEQSMREALAQMLHTVSAAAGRIQLAFRDDENLAPEILADFDLLVTACRSARKALVEQPTKPCEKCDGEGILDTGDGYGNDSPHCPACNGSGTVPVVLVDVQEVAEALRHADYPLAPTTLNAAADFILRRFAPESGSD